MKFVKAQMELASYHPIMAVQKQEEDKRQIYFECMTKTLERFQKKDTLGAFNSVSQFIHCFDLALLDYAYVNHGYLEEDIRELVYEHELIDSKEACDVFAQMAIEICKHLEYVPEDESNITNGEIEASQNSQP